MKKKRALCAFLALVFCAALTPAAFADTDDTADPETERVYAPLPDFYDGGELVIADFEEGADGWETTSETSALYVTNDPEKGKVATLGAASDEAEWLGIKKSYAAGLDLFCYGSVRFAYYVAPAEENTAPYFARIILRSGEEEYEWREQITPLEWGEMSFDISELGFRHKTDCIEISFSGGIRALSVDDLSAFSHTNELYANVYSGKNFICDGAGLGFDPDAGHIVLSVDELSPSLEFEMLSREAELDNSVIFYLDAGDECSALSLFFASGREGFSYDRRISLDAKKGAADYLFTFPSGRVPERLRLVFDGASSGRIEVYSISFVSVYRDDIEACGKISVAEITSDKKSIRVMGGVGYEAALAFASRRLELYVLEPYEDERDVTEKECAASLPMTSRFEFYLDMPEDFSPAKKYVVCIKTADGTPVFIDTAKYISNCGILSPAMNPYEPSSKKGVRTESGEEAFILEAEHTVIEISLDGLFTEKNTGYLHTQGNTYYRFDMDAVSALDKKIKDAYNAGTAIYLRLLSTDPDGRERTPLARDEQSAARLFAAVDFISSRYTGAQMGRVAGFILGRAAETANETGLSLDGYIRDYARTLMLVAGCAKVNNSDCRVVVPVSDDFATRDYSFFSKTGGAYDKRLFISSLCRALASSGGLEWSIALECGDFFIHDREDVICASNLGLLCDYISERKKEYGESPDELMFIFDASGLSEEAFGAAFAYSYYACLARWEVGAFILSAGEDELQRFAELIKYIDTDIGKSYADEYLSYFGADELSGMLPSEGEKALYSGELRTSGDGYTGSFPLWDFGAAYSTLGWQKGVGCGELSHSKENGSAFIGAQFSGETGSLVYVFDAPQSLYPFDAVAFDLEYSGESDAEIAVVLNGKGFSFECDAAVGAGERTTLYFDVTKTANAYEIRSIELVVKSHDPAPTMKLYSVSGLSRSLDDKELEKAKSGKSADEGRPFNSMWIVIMVTLGVASAAAPFLIAKYDKEKKTRS